MHSRDALDWELYLMDMLGSGIEAAHLCKCLSCCQAAEVQELYHLGVPSAQGASSWVYPVRCSLYQPCDCQV